MTQCLDHDSEINDYIERLQEINSSCGMGNIPIVKTLSLPFESRVGTFPSFGLDNLLGVTFSVVFRVLE